LALDLDLGLFGAGWDDGDAAMADMFLAAIYLAVFGLVYL
jgi:hypothetical protein